MPLTVDPCRPAGQWGCVERIGEHGQPADDPVCSPLIACDAAGGRSLNTCAPRARGVPPVSRWIPAIAAPIAIGVGVVLVPMQANAAVDLPDLTPAELLEFAASSEVDALSGTIEQRSELGLPDLCGAQRRDGRRGPAARRDGRRRRRGIRPRSRRPALARDRNAHRHGSTSTARTRGCRCSTGSRSATSTSPPTASGSTIPREKAATHVTVDSAALDALKAESRGARRRGEGAARGRARRAAADPRVHARPGAGEAGRDDRGRVGTDARVAGREAYELVLEPRDGDTLVGEISVAIDAETGAALAASVTARGASEPAFSVAFTEVSFEAPDASVFAFTPPEGTAVTEHDVPVPTAAELEQMKAEHEAGAEGPDGMPRPDRARRGLVDGGRAHPSIGRRRRCDATPPGAACEPDEASAMLDTLAEPRRRRAHPARPRS